MKRDGKHRRVQVHIQEAEETFLRRKEAQKKRTAYLQGPADDNLKKKSLKWMERSLQGTWKDVIKLRNN